ncbi:MAG: ribonuclease D [Rhodospirillales bacterium]|nr:ribonuclease D [Rhodospirillales bacterium]
MALIATTEALAAYCKSLKGSEYVTIDTEFMRERSYWSKLCLVQLAGPNDAQAIDPLADGIDLAPLFELMADRSILKVFHAARQDLEIFFHLTKTLPTPVFDTQVAAMVLGFGDSVGYETLVTRLTRARIDKGSRFSDWARRPLSERQVDYALSDVIHLRPVYETLAGQLAERERRDWLEEEMAVLTAPTTYIQEPREAYRRVRLRGAKPRALAILREVAAWREIEAQRRDMPRAWVLGDVALEEIAHHPPQTLDDLKGMRGVGGRFNDAAAAEQILAAVQRGRTLPESELPKPPARSDLPPGIGPVADILKVLLALRTESFEVAAKMVATTADIEAIAAFGEEADVAALRGWRRQIFGADALRLRNGEIGLRVEGRRLTIVETGPTRART